MELTVVIAKQMKNNSRSDKQKRSIKNCHCVNNKIAKNCCEADYNFSWDQKRVVYRKAGQFLGKSKKLYIF